MQLHKAYIKLNIQEEYNYMKKISDKFISFWIYFSIIVSLLLAEKHTTHDTWWNVIKSEAWDIVLVIAIGMIVEVIMIYYKENKWLSY